MILQNSIYLLVSRLKLLVTWSVLLCSGRGDLMFHLWLTKAGSKLASCSSATWNWCRLLNLMGSTANWSQHSCEPSRHLQGECSCRRVVLLWKDCTSWVRRCGCLELSSNNAFKRVSLIKDRCHHTMASHPKSTVRPRAAQGTNFIFSRTL